MHSFKGCFRRLAVSCEASGGVLEITSRPARPQSTALCTLFKTSRWLHHCSSVLQQHSNKRACLQNTEASGGIPDSQHLPHIEINDPEETPRSHGWTRMRAGRIGEMAEPASELVSEQASAHLQPGPDSGASFLSASSFVPMPEQERMSNLAAEHAGLISCTLPGICSSLRML